MLLTKNACQFGEREKRARHRCGVAFLSARLIGWKNGIPWSFGSPNIMGRCGHSVVGCGPSMPSFCAAHFDHSDSERGACAYQAHLAKSPEPVLLHEWQQEGNLRGWQVKLLDRRLFAPRAVRPGPFVEDIQNAEADFRLEDPFSRREL